MAYFLCPNFNYVPFAIATASALLRRSSHEPVFIISLIPASPPFPQPRCACVHVRAIQGELRELDEIGRGKKVRPFAYTRAKPEERWPHKSDELNRQRIARELGNVGRIPPRLVLDWEELCRSDAKVGEYEEVDEHVSLEAPTAIARRIRREEGIKKREAGHQLQKAQARRLQSMSKLALRKVTDFKNRASRLSTAICNLELGRPITDVLDGWPEQLNSGEMSAVLMNIGDRNWKRALEFYEWLNLRKLYTPNPRLLATILHILGRANQPEVAQNLFFRAEPELASCVQVYNAVLGALAKQGHWHAVQPILERMASVGCEPDIATFNTIAIARCRDGLQPGMVSGLLKEIEIAGLRPDITTYNILLGACFSNSFITEAKEIVKDMEQHGFDLNSCTNYVLGKNYLTSDEEDLHASKLDESSQQQASRSNNVWNFSEDILQQISAPMQNSGVR